MLASLGGRIDLPMKLIASLIYSEIYYMLYHFVLSDSPN